MTVSLRVLVPEETTNYVLNPQFRIDTTGWTANGSTITRTLDRARFGVASLKVVTSGLALNEGVFYRAKNLVGISDSMTASIYVRGAGKVRIRLIDNPKGKEFRGDAVALDDKRWHRLEVTGTITGSDDVRLYVENADSAVKSITYYVDGAQLERKPYSTTYCDGTLGGCRWNNVANKSVSTRAFDTRLGGKWIPLAGTCRPNNDLYVTVLGGLGVPPLINATQPFAEAPGSYVQGYKVADRIITLSFFAKSKKLRVNALPDLSALHELREQLIDIIKPDKSIEGPTLLFEYTENNLSLYFSAHYDGGLEGEWDIRNRWVNSFPLRLIGSDPIIREDSLEAAALDFQDTFNPGAGKLTMFGKENGLWKKTAVSTGPNDNVLALVAAPTGEIYAGGDFTLCDTVPGTVKIAYWDGSAWNQMGGGANNAVRCLAIGLDGSVYAGGDFTVIGGVAANRIAKWNGTTWSALSTGLNSTCYTICVAPNGVVYAGGDFTTAGGTTVNRIARWNGSVWQSVGTGTPGLNNSVRSIVNWIDGATLYVAGAFTDGAALQRYIKTLDINTNLFSNLNGNPFQATTTIYALAVNLTGDVYVAGSLTTAGPASYKIMCYRGSGWQNIESDCNGDIYALAIDWRGYVYAGGEFTLVGGIPARNVAIWGGGVWINADIIPNSPGTNRVDAICVNQDTQDVYIGMFTTVASNTYVAGSTDVTNVGSMYALPVFYLIGPGTLYYIENRTTRVRMYFNLTIQPNEEVFIDTVNATAYSLTRGNMFYGLLPATQLGLFVLNPGLNQISALFFKDVGAKMYVYYNPRHWSVDKVGSQLSS